ncbi:MAG: hypothetical protein QXL25_05300 [Candidatus Bathyarchaeia archaeon]
MTTLYRAYVLAGPLTRDYDLFEYDLQNFYFQPIEKTVDVEGPIHIEIAAPQSMQWNEGKS